MTPLRTVGIFERVRDLGKILRDVVTEDGRAHRIGADRSPDIRLHRATMASESFRTSSAREAIPEELDTLPTESRVDRRPGYARRIPGSTRTSQPAIGGAVARAKERTAARSWVRVAVFGTNAWTRRSASHSGA